MNSSGKKAFRKAAAKGITAEEYAVRKCVLSGCALNRRMTVIGLLDGVLSNYDGH